MSSSISALLTFLPQLLLFARLINIVSHCSRVLLHQLCLVSPSHPSLPLVSLDYTHILKSLILERKFPSAVTLSQVSALSSPLLHQTTFKNSLQPSSLSLPSLCSITSACGHSPLKLPSLGTQDHLISTPDLHHLTSLSVQFKRLS